MFIDRPSQQYGRPQVARDKGRDKYKDLPYPTHYLPFYLPTYLQGTMNMDASQLDF